MDEKKKDFRQFESSFALTYAAQTLSQRERTTKRNQYQTPYNNLIHKRRINQNEEEAKV